MDSESEDGGQPTQAIPDRDKASRNLRAYLMGELDASDEQDVLDALFIHSGLVGELDEIEQELIGEFVGGTLQLEPDRHARLIERWSRPEGKAKLEFAQKIRSLQDFAKRLPALAASAETPRRTETGSRVVEMPRRTGFRLAAGLAAVAGVTAAYLGLRVVSLNSQQQKSNEQTAFLRKQNEKLMEQNAEQQRKLAQLQTPPAVEVPGPGPDKGPRGPKITMAGGDDNSLPSRQQGGQIAVDPSASIFWGERIEEKDRALYEVRIVAASGGAKSLDTAVKLRAIAFRIDPDDLPCTISILRKDPAGKVVATPIRDVRLVAK